MAQAQAQLFSFNGLIAPAFIRTNNLADQKVVQQKKSVINELFENKATLESALNNLFIGSKEENQIQLARKVLGEAVAALSDEELKTYITEFQSLLDSWLDNFEKQLFEDKTLKQLLKEG